LNNVHVHSLRKHEILRKKLLISLLFRSGKSVKGDFLKIVSASLQCEKNAVQAFPVILFAVSKKTIPSAVQRNRAKRMMREAYRLEKTLVERKVENPQEGAADELLCIAFLYTSRKKSFPDLEAFRVEIRGLMQNMRLS